MAITSLDGVAVAMAGSVTLPLNRASISTSVAGSEMSLWRGTGFPAQGAVPAAAAICNNTTTGALPLIAKGGTEDRVILGVAVQMAALSHVLMIEDRLAHMGGLNGTLLTAQTVNVDVSGTTDDLPVRIGAADYSEVNWYLEWYTATGATISTPTAQVTYHDNTTGSVNVWVGAGATALPASVAASRRYRLVPTNGKYIKSVQTVTLSASTVTAGSFGVTAVRPLAKHECTAINTLQVRDWSALNLPKVSDNSCVTFGQMCITTTTGATYGSIVQGKA